MEERSLVPEPVLHENISDDKFQNWTKCVLAQNETKKALCEVVEIKWKNYLVEMTEEERNQIETFVQCLKNDKIHNFETERKLSCTHDVCATLSHKFLNLRIVKEEQDPEEMTHIPSYDACFQYYSDIAKLYLFTGDDKLQAGLKELDISYLSRMMSTCQLFAFDGCLQSYQNIRQDRDELFHSTENHITGTRMTIMLDNLVNLLSKYDESRLSICKDIGSDIQKLKEKQLQEEYQPFEYKLLVKKCLEDKVAALELDMSLDENKPLLDVLQETQNILLQVNEGIAEEDTDEITELQAEVDRLKETIENLKGERDAESKERMSEISQLKETIKDLKTERDTLQSSNSQLEDLNMRFKQLVDGDVSINDLKLVASIVETKEEFLVSLELLPLALKETTTFDEHRSKVEIIEAGFDPSEIADCQEQLACHLQDVHTKVVSCLPYIAKNIRNLARSAHECQTRMVDCFRDCKPSPATKMIIQMTKIAINLKKSGISHLLLRQLGNMEEKYIEVTRNSRDSYYNMVSYVQREISCMEYNNVGQCSQCLRKARHVLDECASTLNRIILILTEQAAFGKHRLRRDKDTYEMLIQCIFEDDLHEAIFESISTIESELAKVYTICQIYVEKASPTIEKLHALGRS